jgi:hypothetical protein
MNRPNWKKTFVAVLVAPSLTLLPTAAGFALEAPRLFLAVYAYGYPIALAITVAFLLPWHLWQGRGDRRPPAWRYAVAGIVAAAVPLTALNLILLGGEFRADELRQTFLFAAGHGALGGLLFHGLTWGWRRSAPRAPTAK